MKALVSANDYDGLKFNNENEALFDCTENVSNDTFHILWMYFEEG